jgi:hypothetical protein
MNHLLRFSLFAMLLCGLAGWRGAAYAAEDGGKPLTIKSASGTDISVTRYPASGTSLLLWLPSENGLAPAEWAAAQALSKRGIEVWMADMLGAYFLPLLPSSLEKIPAADVADVIEYAVTRSGKRVYVLVAGRGAVPALQGVAEWQRRNALARQGKVAGAILLYPNLYVATPEAGEDAEYLPIASGTHLDIAILQPELSPWFWRLDDLKARLERGGGHVHITTLPGTRDRFHAREDTKVPLPSERAMAERLPELLYDSWRELPPKGELKR